MGQESAPEGLGSLCQPGAGSAPGAGWVLRRALVRAAPTAASPMSRGEAG